MNKKYDPEPPTPEQVLLADFVKDTYLPWSRLTKVVTMTMYESHRF